MAPYACVTTVFLQITSHTLFFSVRDHVTVINLFHKGFCLLKKTVLL